MNALSYIDVDYLGMPRLIACGVLETNEGLLLVDPGPTSSLHTLERKLEEAGASLADVHGLLLTHIHLDHAGATGSIVAAHPSIQVYVHDIGARHMIAPERLLNSARRLYGDEMDRLWGDFLAVPEGNVHRLRGGETLTIGGRAFAVAYTPGHAVHHVSYLDEKTGTAYVGDVAGMRLMGVNYVLPVAPPPDIHLGQWQESIEIVRRWHPERLFLTHFATSEAVEDHLEELSRRLDDWGAQVQRSLENRGEDAERAEVFKEEALDVVRAELSEADTKPFAFFGQPLASWYGLARYWRKQARTTSESA